jgi:hypothetical protein
VAAAQRQVLLLAAVVAGVGAVLVPALWEFLNPAAHCLCRTQTLEDRFTAAAELGGVYIVLR